MSRLTEFVTGDNFGPAVNCHSENTARYSREINSVITGTIIATREIMKISKEFALQIMTRTGMRTVFVSNFVEAVETLKTLDCNRIRFAWFVVGSRFGQASNLVCPETIASWEMSTGWR